MANGQVGSQVERQGPWASFYLNAMTLSAELLSWWRSSVRPSINLGFSETAAWIQAKFYGRYLIISNISRPFFFLFFKISTGTFQIFTIFFPFSLTCGSLLELKFQNATSPTVCHSFDSLVSTKRYYKYVHLVMREYRLFTFFGNLQILKNFMAL